MNNPAKILIFCGAGLTLAGALLWLTVRYKFPLGRLPGDIYMHKNNFSFYFPITTCVLISVIISLVLWFMARRG